MKVEEPKCGRVLETKCSSSEAAVRVAISDSAQYLWNNVNI